MSFGALLITKLKECVGLEDTSLSTWIDIIWAFGFCAGKTTILRLVLSWSLAILGFGRPKGIVKVILVLAAWVVWMGKTICPTEILVGALVSALLDRFIIRPIRRLIQK